MDERKAIELIKSKEWDLRVTRPGFLQSKYIVSRALTQKIQLTNSASVYDDSNLWIGDISLYSQNVMEDLAGSVFDVAFGEDKDWPLKILEELVERKKEKDDFIQRISQVDWLHADTEVILRYVGEYVQLLFEIQKFYSFAVPLTNYCEQYLHEHDESLLKYAVQYQRLDVDTMNASLLTVKEAKERGDEARLQRSLKEHLKEFGWIKTNYNIVAEYTADEVLEEANSDIHVFDRMKAPEGEHRYIVIAIQIGIYLRNSMKEMSQQLWFSYHEVTKAAAKRLSISEEDFLQLHPDEAISSLTSNRLTVTMSEIQARHKGFIVGVLENEDIILTGPVVERLSQHFSAVDTDGVEQFRGNVASKGFVVGTAKVIFTIKEIDKLEEGDILVTSMTTPDFVVAMKKAGAIVTDEGGLSCHAAIVSRELKKPCVIGTKIATQVLKDGDEVEVDANKGMVRVLQKE